MAKISIHEDHRLSRQEAHRRMEQLEPELKGKYGVQLAWHGDEADIKSSRLSGKVVVADTAVDINLSLGLPLLPFQGKIKSTIQEEVRRKLG